ncbi:hypothetical protein PENTCL1PPCAC_734, partial [Pristionchus entomophagus]
EEGCPCSERETRAEVCGMGLCTFPRHTCCKGFKKALTVKGLECHPEKEQVPISNAISSRNFVAKNRTEVPSDLSKDRAKKEGHAVWGEWMATPCTDTCGACGETNLVRDCLCAGEEGCPCSGQETRVEVCGMELCQFPRHPCCKGFKKVFTVKGLECHPKKEQAPISNAIASRNFVAKNPTEGPSDLPKDRIKTEGAAVWGKWIASTPCTDSCGSCGRTNLTRECLCAGEDECPCSEPETREEVCATKLCQFPRHTCCEGFKKVATARGFECASEDSLVHNSLDTTESNSLDETNAEVINDVSESLDNHEIQQEDSVWGEWIVSTPCTSDCGACGNIGYVRDCLCAGEEGCPCRDQETRVEVCATELCQFPRRTCCDGFKKKATVEGFRCVVDEKEDKQKKGDKKAEKVVSENAVIPPSLSAASRKFLLKKKAQLEEILLASSSTSNCSWGEWIEVNSHCSGTCGMCGVRVSARRHCQPSECNCVGASTRYEDCGEGICEGREKECCGFYIKSSVNGVPTCIDPEAVDKEKTLIR